MARKRTLIDELVTMPWWFNLALSVVVYLTLKHGLPSIEYKSPVVKSMAGVLSSFAGMFALLLVFLAGGFLHSIPGEEVNYSGNRQACVH